jgi:hypothetical protein
VDRGDRRVAARQAPERQPGGEQLGIGDRRAEARGQVGDEAVARVGPGLGDRLLERFG